MDIGHKYLVLMIKKMQKVHCHYASCKKFRYFVPFHELRALTEWAEKKINKSVVNAVGKGEFFLI